MAKSIGLAACVASIAIGCGGARESAKSAREGQDGREPSAKTGASESNPEHTDEAGGSEEASSSGEHLPGAPPTTDVGFDFHAWCYDHGVEANLQVEQCEPSGLGKPPGDAIWCARHEDTADGIALYYQSLYVVRGKRVVRLLEIPIAAGLTAEVGKAHPEGEHFVVKLTRENSADAKSVTLSEDPKLDCAHGTEQSKDLSITDPKIGPKLGAAIQKVCAARGRYAWTGNALSKVSSKP